MNVKKLLGLLSFLMLFSACGKDGMNGMDGMDGKDGSITSVFYFKDVRWVPQSDGSYSALYPNFKELTKDVRDWGSVNVYLLTEDSDFQLPYLFFNDDKGYKWTEMYSYRTAIREIEFYYSTSDHIPNIPNSTYFKVVLTSP